MNISQSLNSRRRRYYIGILTVVALVAIGFLLFLLAKPENFETSPKLLQAATTIESEEWVPEPPVRLVIPSIEVDAEIQYVGLAPDGSGEMDIPSNFTDVGWYKDGVRPGMKGSAVIAGHLNGKKVPEAVFFDLDKLEVGDEVVIMSAERVEDIFFVVKIETYDYNEATEEVFLSTDGKKRLNLITCGGNWLPEENVYDKRTVVFTELLTDVE